MTYRSQRVLLWWALIFLVIYGIALWALLDMVPPPSPKLSAVQIAHWYAVRHTRIRIGAVIASWTSAFMIPLAIVCAQQIKREEPKNCNAWTWCALIGGSMTSIFLVLPPLFWGVAAFTPNRDPQVTSIMHELGVLSFTSTDQYFVFMWVAIIVLCFRRKTVKHSPFPRWFGYLSIWLVIMFEAGAFSFLPRSGPLAWNGLLVFWVPLPLFGIWIVIQSYLLLKSLSAQQADAPEAAITI
jgi:hypothetical protein